MEWSRSNILGYDVHFQIKYIGFFETNPVTLFFSSFLRAYSFSVTLCFIFVDVYMFFIYYDYQREVMSTDFLRNWCFASNFFLTYIKFRSMLIVSIIVSFPCLSHEMWALLIRLNLFFHSCVFGWGDILCKIATAQLIKIIPSGKGISIRATQTSSESIH